MGECRPVASDPRGIHFIPCHISQLHDLKLVDIVDFGWGYVLLCGHRSYRSHAECLHWTSQRHPPLPNFRSDHTNLGHITGAVLPEPMGFELETLWVIGYEGVNP